MGTIFYIHIDSGNLANYYSCGCIRPCKYFPSRIHDVQASFDSFILLSKKRYAKKTDCSLEVILTHNEESILIPIDKNGNIFLFNNALPITRIKKIYFQSESTKDKITTLINLSSGFILDDFSTVLIDNKYADYTGLVMPSEANVQDLTDKIIKYDRILGGLALMRLSGEEYMNYSENYISTLSRFNSVIEADLFKAKRKINDIYWDAFDGKDKFKMLFPYINKKLIEDDLYELAKMENQLILKSKISGIVDINSLEHASYIIAVLYNYGLSAEGRKNKIDGLILGNFKKEIKEEKSEVISLCYGLNRGYSVFNNKYKISNNEKIVKFELNSQLDYYTIESIYQFVFNNIPKSSQFPYLDSWCPKLPLQNKKLKRNEYIILDRVVIGEIIKVGSSKWWSNFMLFFFQKENEELFKPFITKLYERIKTDIEGEAIETIEENNLQIKSMFDEKIAMQNKLDELHVIQEHNNRLLEEKSVLQIKLNEISKLQEETLKFKLENDLIKQNALAETSVIYQTPNKLSPDYTDYKHKYEAYHKLIKDISNQTNIKEVKKVIQKHTDVTSFSNPDLFSDNGKT